MYMMCCVSLYYPSDFGCTSLKGSVSAGVGYNGCFFSRGNWPLNVALTSAYLAWSRSVQLFICAAANEEDMSFVFSFFCDLVYLVH